MFEEPLSNVTIAKELIEGERDKGWMVRSKKEEINVKWKKVDKETSGSIF